MKILSILICIAFAFDCCNGQAVKWPTTKNWKIYEGEGFQIFRYPLDTLQHIKSKSLEMDSIQFYIQKSQTIPPEKTPVWMGSYLASYESADGKINKVEVSVYGGFFYDQTSGKYYEIPLEFRTQWLNYITKNVPE